MKLQNCTYINTSESVTYGKDEVEYHCSRPKLTLSRKHKHPNSRAIEGALWHWHETVQSAVPFPYFLCRHL